ncbi:hypothetical protein [Carnobacterium maltaromaticum]|uniref:hypothetical protein n=1 Tax=Carnobacterium maltaromaticum TaxID=2751 RepID=UPI0039BE278A
MKNKIVLFLILLTVVLSGCSKKIDIKDFEQPLDKDTSVEDLKEVNEIKENGYKMGDYVYILGGLKYNDEIAKSSIAQLPQLEKMFKEVESRIDVRKKINVIPYSIFYYEDIEAYKINVLLFNTSKEAIKKGSYDSYPIMDAEITKLDGGITKFEEHTDSIRPMEFMSLALNFPLKKEDYALLKEVKPENIEFVVQDLIINGESVSNEN